MFRVRKDDKEGQVQYLNFLRVWLKDKEYVALAYMTGILPIKKYGQHSALNMFGEYSMIAPMQLAPSTGFTDEEVRLLCRRYALYSPLSVVNALRFGVIQNYWNNTESYEALAEYIRRDCDGLKDTVALLLDGGRVRVDLSTYQNDMTTFHGKDDILALLIHLGFLGYDAATGEVFIPNREILKSPAWRGGFRAFETSKELLQATWAMDGEKVVWLLEAGHDQASNRTYHDEAALSYGIQLAYDAAEKYRTKALEQIRRRNYPAGALWGRILLVSISYDRDLSGKQDGFKHHRCRIERA